MHSSPIPTISLRDQIALAVLNGMASTLQGHATADVCTMYSAQAYRFADAMLKEREKNIGMESRYKHK